MHMDKVVVEYLPEKYIIFKLKVVSLLIVGLIAKIKFENFQKELTVTWVIRKYDSSCRSIVIIIIKR